MSSANSVPSKIEYQVHISRSESWNESEENPILLDEWIRLVERADEMQLAYPRSHLDRIHDVPARDRDGLACWTGWSRHAADNAVWFKYENGRVTVSNPDTEVLRRMAWIARNLEAQVQGDRGEIYDIIGEPITVPDDDYQPGVFEYFRKFRGFCWLLLPISW